MSDNPLSQQVAELEAEIKVLRDELAAHEDMAVQLDIYRQGERIALLKKKDNQSAIVRFRSNSSDDEIIKYVQDNLSWGKSTDEIVFIVRLESKYGVSPKLEKMK